jgi:hypothetical protein
MEKLIFEGISHNLQYVFTNRGVSRISEQLNDLNGKNYVSYSHNNLNVAIDIMKENTEFKFKTGKLDLVEYAAAPRRFLNNIVEIFQPENSISLIREWETIFGNDLLLINESVDNLIIESRINESWESFKVLLEWTINPFNSDFYSVDNFREIGSGVVSGVAKGAENVYNYGKEKVQQFKKWGGEQIKQIQQKGIWNYAKEKGAALWDTVKNAVKSAYKCLTNNFAECLMEGIRGAVMSAGGIAVLTGISMIPAIGQIPTVIIFGALLLWDLYKMMSGKYESGEYQWNIFDIIVDIVSLLLPALGKIIKVSMGGIKTFAQFGKAAISKGGVLLKVFTAMKVGIVKLGGYVTKAATWLGEKLGMTSLKNWGSKASAQLSKITDDIAAGSGGKLNKIVKKSVSKTKPVSISQKVKSGLNKVYRPDLGKAIPATGVIVKSAGKAFLVTTAICAALGLNGATCTEKIESGEITPEQYEAAKKQADIDMSKAMEADDSGLDLMSL